MFYVLRCYRMSKKLIAELPVLRVYKSQALLYRGQQCCLCLSPYQVTYSSVQCEIRKVASFNICSLLERDAVDSEEPVVIHLHLAFFLP